METLFCKTCGTEKEYHTEMKSGQLTAWCNDCNSYLKNVAYDEPRFYIGKYKGKTVAEVYDFEYLKWFVINIKGNKRLKEAIKEKLNGET